ncbi:Rad9-domain-containing protein [Abortiporus biennis]|nr:Rad9-domain-containing protein [Abortiporus biennis]
MQATIDSLALKQFTKILTCLTKFGEDLTIHAKSKKLILHTSNMASTGYSKFVLSSSFFVRYKVSLPGVDGSKTAGTNGNGGIQWGNDGLNEEGVEDDEDENNAMSASVDGQVNVKSFLAILKHRTVEKTVTKCDLSIVHPDSNNHNRRRRRGESDSDEDEEYDSLESKLIVKLHCKHGVVKTHKLLLSSISNHRVPSPLSSSDFNVSKLSISPKQLHDMIDHFHGPGGGNAAGKAGAGSGGEKELIWIFEDGEVTIRDQESGMDSGGSRQIATELTIASDEFEDYNLHITPIAIGFYLREFNAILTFSEQSNFTLHIRFTSPHDPLYIQTDSGETYESLFVIGPKDFTNSTSRSTSVSTSVHSSQRIQHQQRLKKKRPLPDDDDDHRTTTPINDLNDPTMVVQKPKPPAPRNGKIPPPGSSSGSSSTGKSDNSSRTGERDRSMPPPPMPPPSIPPISVMTGDVEYDFQEFVSAPAPSISAPPHPPVLSAAQPKRTTKPIPRSKLQPGQTSKNGTSASSVSPLQNREPLFLPSQTQPPSRGHLTNNVNSTSNRPQKREPLFLPSSQPGFSQMPPPTQSQLQMSFSQAERELLKQSGLGIEDMNMEEFEEMLMGDGIEVEVQPQPQPHHNKNSASSSNFNSITESRSSSIILGNQKQLHKTSVDEMDFFQDLDMDMDDGTQMGPTQSSTRAMSGDDDERSFKPLFDD